MIANLILKIITLYLYILIGYGVRYLFSISHKFFSKILFFVLIPAMVFKAILLSEAGIFLFLVGLSFFTSFLLAVLSLLFWEKFKTLSISKGVFQCCYSYFNVGWFGIPIVYVIFGEQEAFSMTALYIGGMLFGHFVGYYLINKQLTLQTAQPKYDFRALLKNPSIYAIILGFGLSYFNAEEIIETSFVNSLYYIIAILTSFFGMFLVGMSLYGLSIKNVQWKLISFFLISRLFLSAMVVSGLVFLLKYFQVLSSAQINTYALIAILPIAANIIVFIQDQEDKNKEVPILLLLSTTLSCFILSIFIFILNF
jgi:predicted permease